MGSASLFEGLQPEGTPNKPVLTPLMADVSQLSCFSSVSLKTYSVVLSTVSIWCPPLLWGRGLRRGLCPLMGDSGLRRGEQRAQTHPVLQEIRRAIRWVGVRSGEASSGTRW